MASTQPSSGPSATTIIIATIGTLTALGLGYAAYFDHKRRSDPNFRKKLKRAQRQVAKAEKESAASAERDRSTRIKAAVEQANEEGFPTDPELTEQYFMEQIEKGEKMTAAGEDEVDTALCFYRALKVYPQPRELITIYDKTVSKPIIDILADMIANDRSIPVGPAGSSGSSRGSDDGSLHVE